MGTLDTKCKDFVSNINAYQRRSNLEECLEEYRMIQKVDISKSWSLVISVLDDGHMNEMGIVGEMEGTHGPDFIGSYEQG